MTREEYKLKSLLIGLATLALPILGTAAFFIKPLLTIAPILFYIGPFVLLITFIIVKYKENKIPWEDHQCPYCGESFQAQPKDGKVKHLICKNELYLKDGKVFKKEPLLG